MFRRAVFRVLPGTALAAVLVLGSVPAADAAPAEDGDARPVLARLVPAVSVATVAQALAAVLELWRQLAPAAAPAAESHGNAKSGDGFPSISPPDNGGPMIDPDG